MRHGHQQHQHSMLGHAMAGRFAPLSLRALQAYDVLPNCTALYQDCLYDSAPYAAAGQSQLTFFANQEGQVGGIAGNKTYTDTNMDQGGQLSKGTGFLVENIEVEFQPSRPTPAANPSLDMPANFGAQQAANIINDAYVFGCGGYLQFKGPNQQTFLINGPMNQFPSSHRFSIDAALADTSTVAGSKQSRIAYGQWEGKPFNLHPVPIYLDSNMAFSVILFWPEGSVALPSGNPARIYVRLQGIRTILGADARHDPAESHHGYVGQHHHLLQHHRR